MRVCEYVRACECGGVRAGLRAFVRACVRARARACNDVARRVTSLRRHPQPGAKRARSHKTSRRAAPSPAACALALRGAGARGSALHRAAPHPCTICALSRRARRCVSLVLVRRFASWSRRAAPRRGRHCPAAYCIVRVAGGYPG